MHGVHGEGQAQPLPTVLLELGGFSPAQLKGRGSQAWLWWVRVPLWSLLQGTEVALVMGVSGAGMDRADTSEGTGEGS